MGIASPPEIKLPDIVIPDIILPEFRIPPFLEIKLPNFYIEDLILPDIELCNIDECANIFPSLSFNFLALKLPPLRSSAPIPYLNTSVSGGVDFPSISLSLPSLNLFNSLAPEISIPQIPLPKPVISFSIGGIDTSAIFDLIFTFILNALDVPDFGGCLILEIPSTFLSIIYPDYYISFEEFPEIPEIPYCDDINGFCKDLKDSLGNNGWLNKTRQIEEIVNEKISQVQEKINESVGKAEGELQTQLNSIFEDYANIIYDQIQKQLSDAGLSIQDYINPQTGLLDLDQVPFPGVVPVGFDQEIQGSAGKKVKRCLPVSLPERNIILRFISLEKFQQKTKKVERKGNNVIIYLPLDIPNKIPIPWPDDLKEIPLDRPIGYDVPPIPLSKLSRHKTIPIEGPGFQPRSFLFSFGSSSGDCIGGSATGGNPVPLTQLESSLDRLKDLKTSFDNTFQTIKNILE